MYNNYQMKTKKAMVYINLIILFICIGITNNINAQSLVYRPTNPAFGGNFYNYSWMLSSAEAQNIYKTSNSSSTRSTTTSSSTLDSFSDNLSRQLLSRITSQVLQNQFGEQTLKEGTYQYGDLRLDVSNGRDGINIRIIDNKGGETVITIPYY